MYTSSCCFVVTLVVAADTTLLSIPSLPTGGVFGAAAQ